MDQIEDDVERLPQNLDDPNYSFRRCSSEELDLVGQEFGHELPFAYRYLFENFDNLCLVDHLFCRRDGIRGVMDAHGNVSLGAAPQLALSNWFAGLRSDLEWDPGFVPWTRNLLPFAKSPSGGRFCLDFAFDSAEPPVVRFSPEVHESHEMFTFVADDLLSALQLPQLPSGSDELSPAPTCVLSDRARAWWAWYDELVAGVSCN